jgi:hypothetical protein
VGHLEHLEQQGQVELLVKVFIFLSNLTKEHTSILSLLVLTEAVTSMLTFQLELLE